MCVVIDEKNNLNSNKMTYRMHGQDKKGKQRKNKVHYFR